MKDLQSYARWVLNFFEIQKSRVYHSCKWTSYQTQQSEWVERVIINGTSAQLGYTVPCTLLVHTGKYRTEDELKITENTQTKHNPEKANNTKNSKTKLAWFSRLLQHSARKRRGLFYNAPKPTRGYQTQPHSELQQYVSQHIRCGQKLINCVDAFQYSTFT